MRSHHISNALNGQGITRGKRRENPTLHHALSRLVYAPEFRMSETSNIVTLDSYLTPSEVTKIVTISNSTIYRWIEEGTFLRLRQLGANCARWRAADIKSWQDTRPTRGVTTKAS